MKWVRWKMGPKWFINNQNSWSNRARTCHIIVTVGLNPPFSGVQTSSQHVGLALETCWNYVNAACSTCGTPKTISWKLNNGVGGRYSWEWATSVWKFPKQLRGFDISWGYWWAVMLVAQKPWRLNEFTGQQMSHDKYPCPISWNKLVDRYLKLNVSG